MSSPDSRSAISSPASVDGATPYDLPDGLMTDLFGLDRARASPSALRASGRGRATIATCGRVWQGSLSTQRLQWFLGNRLMERLDGAGSTDWRMIWRRRVTPSGLRFLAHVPSERRIYVQGSTGLRLPTVTCHDSRMTGALVSRGFSPSLSDWFRRRYGFLSPPATVTAWMMGYPPAWCECAVTAMRSCPKSPRRSSVR